MKQKISDFSLYGLLYKNESCSLQFQVVWKLRLDPGNPHQSASQVVLGIVHNPLWRMDGWNIRGESHHLCFFQCLIHGCNLKFANKKKQHGSPNWQHFFYVGSVGWNEFPHGFFRIVTTTYHHLKRNLTSCFHGWPSPWKCFLRHQMNRIPTSWVIGEIGSKKTNLKPT